ncbi:MAG: hypothetical protein N4A76_10345 [Firmicutes bacterium]|jgi:hypothetical protein|nr:hypothetical protein [Bacillota bacterium]
MSRDILEDIEFEKNRQAILKQRGKTREESVNQQVSENQKFAWEYELEEYRKSKKREKLYGFGAFCGILSLVITLYFNYEKIVALFGF